MKEKQTHEDTTQATNTSHQGNTSKKIRSSKMKNTEITFEQFAEASREMDPRSVSILYDLMYDVNKKIRRAQMSEALCALQEKCQNVTKNVTARYTYANLEQWIHVTKQAVSDAGFAIVCEELTEGNDDKDHFTIRMSLVYKNGEQISAQARFPRDKTGKTDVQSVGSTITYARRYLLGMLLNITTRDDDTDGEIIPAKQLADPKQIEEIRQLIKVIDVDEFKVLAHIQAPSWETVTTQQASKALSSLRARMAATKG